jgi:hypothetical protein
MTSSVSKLNLLAGERTNVRQQTIMKGISFPYLPSFVNGKALVYFVFRFQLAIHHFCLAESDETR